MKFFLIKFQTPVFFLISTIFARFSPVFFTNLCPFEELATLLTHKMLLKLFLWTELTKKSKKPIEGIKNTRVFYSPDGHCNKKRKTKIQVTVL